MDASMPPLPEVQRRDVDERTTLLDMLDYYRAVLLRKAWGLDADQLAVTIPPSDLSLGGLLKHMALVEHAWFPQRFAGRPVGEPWASVNWDVDRDWDFHSAADDDPADLIAMFQREVGTAREVIAAAELDDLGVAMRRPVNLRWILVHMIEEYARHVGHADLLRESIDGSTGD